VVIARSDHGSSVLPEALAAAGIPYDEVILYRLERPADAGDSVHATAAGDVDALAFTSSLTVTHFMEIAHEDDIYDGILAHLPQVTVGAIGDPTAQTLREHAIEPDCIPSEATADALIEEIFDHLSHDR
jgi:Uroporphyrinogen-III synthase